MEIHLDATFVPLDSNDRIYYYDLGPVKSYSDFNIIKLRRTNRKWKIQRMLNLIVYLPIPRFVLI